MTALTAQKTSPWSSSRSNLRTDDIAADRSQLSLCRHPSDSIILPMPLCLKRPLPLRLTYSANPGVQKTRQPITISASQSTTSNHKPTAASRQQSQPSYVEIHLAATSVLQYSVTWPMSQPQSRTDGGIRISLEHSRLRGTTAEANTTQVSPMKTSTRTLWNRGTPPSRDGSARYGDSCAKKTGEILECHRPIMCSRWLDPDQHRPIL